MSVEELVEQLKVLNDPRVIADVEKNHKKADELLLDYIGNEQVTQAFNELERWYS